MTPIVLSASVNLAAGASGSPNLQKLIPPMNRPMLVSDISFTVRTGSSTFFVGSSADFQFGGIILANLYAGRMALTRGFVPVTNFAPLYSRNYDRSNPFFNNVLSDALVTSQGEFYNHWRWPLPKPMYLGPGEGINPTFQRSTIFDSLLAASIVSGTFQVTISVHGSLLFEPKSGKRQVPFVSSFTPTALLANGGYAQGDEHDLSNTTDKPIYMQRFVGHITVPTEGGNCITPGAGAAAQVELFDSKGYALTFGATSNRVKWGSLFPEQRRAWTYNGVLDSGEKYPCAVVADATNSLITVSMIGTREEDI